MEVRIEKVIELVRLKPEDLIFKGKAHASSIHWNLYHYLSRLIFFNNQLCRENIIDLEEINWNLDLIKQKMPLRTTQVCEVAMISKFQEIVNFPSIELIKVRMCDLRTIQEFKEYIIKTFLVINFIRMPSLPKPKITKVINLRQYTEFKKKQKQDIQVFLAG